MFQIQRGLKNKDDHPVAPAPLWLSQCACGFYEFFSSLFLLCQVVDDLGLILLCVSWIPDHPVE